MALLDAAQAAKRKALSELHSKDRKKRGRGIDKETAKILEMRAQVVKELFETENTYGDQLKVLLKSCVDPLKSFAAESKPDSPLNKVVNDPAVAACLNALPLISDLTSKIRYTYNVRGVFFCMSVY